jgi:hypothetical protein
LHKSSCSHINDRRVPESKYIGGGKIKVCSNDLDEIKKWAEKRINFKKFKECLDCKPL